MTRFPHASRAPAFAPRATAGCCVLAFCLLACACGGAASYAVPPQQSLDLGQDPAGLGAWVEMADPAYLDYVVRDISPEPGDKRWAFRHPEPRFRVEDVTGVKFRLEMLLPEATFKATGPVTVTAAIDGKPLGSTLCRHAEDCLFEELVPSGWLQPGQQVNVALEAGPRWIAPEDHNELSFMVRRGGFIH